MTLKDFYSSFGTYLNVDLHVNLELPADSALSKPVHCFPHKRRTTMAAKENSLLLSLLKICDNMRSSKLLEKAKKS